jgi:hypothetical protein
MTKMNEHAEKIVKYYNKYDGTNPEVLNEFYTDDVVFEDPVTKLHGLNQLKKYYAKTYKNVKSIRFEFADIFHQGAVYGAPWKLHIAVRGLNGGKEYVVPGFSQLKFEANGLVSEHRDYVDLGDMVYERIPIQGIIISTLKKLMKI